ncbi:MAG TPA: hypothetical protein VMF91_16300 [Bryobacteraceae bacterium]|nr:hypothetical protein [Bryobacteraceae bacterium]
MCLSPGRGQAEIDKAVEEIGSNATGVKTDTPSSTTSTASTQIPLCRKTRIAEIWQGPPGITRV